MEPSGAPGLAEHSFAGLAICLVGPEPPPAGGMALQTRQLQALLVQEGATVEHVPSNAPYPWEWAGRIPYLRALSRLLPYLLKLWSAIGRAQLVHLMANSGWSWHLFCAPVIWIGWMRGVPVVVNYRGGEADAFMKRARWAVSPSLKRARTLVVPSNFLREVFKRYGFSAQVVPNVVDLSIFSPAPATASNRRRTILIARNLEPIYGLNTAIDAFARLADQLPDVDLLIAGTGPLEAELRNQASATGLGDRIQFLGRLNRRAMVQYLRSASIALNASTVDNSPNSLLEAMAVGAPIVSTNVGGVPFLVQNEVTALLVPPEDPQAMAGALLRLLSDPVLSDQLRQGGLEQVKRHSWQQVRQALLSQYLLAVQGCGTPPLDAAQGSGRGDWLKS